MNQKEKSPLPKAVFISFEYANEAELLAKLEKLKALEKTDFPSSEKYLRSTFSVEL